MNANVCGLTACSAKRLMDKNLSIRLAPTLTLCSGGGQKNCLLYTSDAADE